MASNFLDQWKKAGRRINHTGFDIAGKRVYTMPAGLMVTPFFAETNPNEHFQIDVNGLMRTETMNTAAFINGRILTSLFFVPYSQIWHNFNSFVTQKDDRHSSQQRGLAYLPWLSLEKVYRWYFDMYISYLWVKASNNFEEPSHVADEKLDPWELAFDDWCDESPFDASNTVHFSYFEDMHGVPYVHNLTRALQYFRIGTAAQVYEYIDEYMANNYEATGDYATDVAAYKAYLAQAASSFISTYFSGDSFFTGKKINIFKMAAYQHIFYDYYRNKYFDEEPYFNGYDLDVRYIDVFNYDDIECTNVSTAEIPFNIGTNLNRYDSLSAVNARIVNLFDLHYRQYKHDIFTSAMNSTQFGAVSSVGFDGEVTPNFGDGSSYRLLRLSSNGSLEYTQYSNSEAVTGLQTQTLDYTTPVGDYTAGTAAIYGTNLESDSLSVGIDVNKADFMKYSSAGRVPMSLHIPSLFDVLQLRRAELLQQWKMNALRAGNMVDDNFRQHYGVEPYYEGDNNVRLIGSWETPLDTKPITATSSTGAAVNGQVGDLAAIGFGSTHNQKVRFKSNDFGVVVAVSYFLPDVFYTANGIDENNTLLEPFDFYSEEFENTGFESLPFWTQSILHNKLSDNNMGYVPPYTRYKTNVDLVFGEFGSSTMQYSGYDAQGTPVCKTFDGSLRAWTMQREDIPVYQVNGVAVRGKQTFYVSPMVTNPLFALNYDGRQATDPIHCFFNFDFKALRPMSVLGLPIFQ